MAKIIDRNIFVTAGHHNQDAGAVQNGVKEADLTKELRDLICDQTNFFKDRDDWNLQRTIGWLNSNKTTHDINVDVHFNSSANAKATGVEVIVANNASQLSRQLAKTLTDGISDILKLPNRGVKTESQTARGRIGILAVRGVSVLIEVCFISNKSDLYAYLKSKNEVALFVKNTLQDF